jgi:hypothetical protein
MNWTSSSESFGLMQPLKFRRRLIRLSEDIG